MQNTLPAYNSSLWQVSATPAPRTTTMDGDTRCDVIIVGAGFTGLRAAHLLAKAGVSVAVLEQGIIGHGASGRSGGQVNMGYKLDPDDLHKAVGAHMATRMLKAITHVGDEVFNHIKDHKLNCDAQQSGWIKASHCSAALRFQEKQHAQWRRHGFEFDFLSADEIQKRSGAHGYVGALFYSRGGSIQPMSYTRELARIAIEAGARVYENTPAVHIEQTTHGVTVDTGFGVVKAEKLIICTNGYTGSLWPGLKRSVVPIRSIVAATEPLPVNLRDSVLPSGSTLSDLRRFIYYFRLDRDYRLCFGGLGPFRDDIGPGDFTSLLRGARKVFPCLENIKWDYHWSGRLAITRDNLPHINQLAPNVTAGFGFNGRGVGLATIMGRVLAEKTLGKPHDELDLPITETKPFPFHRFHGLGFTVASSWLKARDIMDTLRTRSGS